MDTKQLTIDAMQGLVERHNLDLVLYHYQPNWERLVFTNGSGVIDFDYEPQNGYYTSFYGPFLPNSSDGTGKFKYMSRSGLTSVLDELLKQGVSVPTTKEQFTVEGIPKIILQLVGEISRRESSIFGD